MTKTRRSEQRRPGLRAVLAIAVLAVSGLAAGVSPAAAATPCWKLVLNDWFVDGRIDKTYPVSCYTEAQQHLGEDAVNYSGAPADIHRALLAAIRQDRGGGPGRGGGSGTGLGGGTSHSGGISGGGGGGGGGVSPPSGSGPASGSGPTATHKGPIQRAIDWVGPSNADSIPLPLLVLAGIALLLLAAAAASLVARRVQARRLEGVPAPAPRGSEQP